VQIRFLKILRAKTGKERTTIIMVKNLHEREIDFVYGIPAEAEKIIMTRDITFCEDR
jgi:hypothetical protein